MVQIEEVVTVLTEMEYGIRLIKEEFRQGVHTTIGSVVRQIDRIMKSSVLRA
jgi:hypothetical protein